MKSASDLMEFSASVPLCEGLIYKTVRRIHTKSVAMHKPKMEYAKKINNNSPQIFKTFNHKWSM